MDNKNKILIEFLIGFVNPTAAIALTKLLDTWFFAVMYGVFIILIGIDMLIDISRRRKR